MVTESGVSVSRVTEDALELYLFGYDDSHPANVIKQVINGSRARAQMYTNGHPDGCEHPDGCFLKDKKPIRYKRMVQIVAGLVKKYEIGVGGTVPLRYIEDEIREVAGHQKRTLRGYISDMVREGWFLPHEENLGIFRVVEMPKEVARGWR
jgi:hypothetical protein